ncbi:hypothetical protein SAMN02799631_05895 [Methylobacterium sp. 174MFSha1.1]|uniref:hypothetical protein n=1 Tax=Methylobacterium sp. 174MFSha1.1 TaxID=1502749 RepID=UPI0008EE8030|nr:hypothetical protein [Methylobacterium sp. 174MFSha1.1]SFV14533.1 hypothetical protein SAMN02799631_05895 [Methylobacterium sp. 174MFSha1.1]
MTDHLDKWGPFSPALEPAERIARCRGLEAVVHLITGPDGNEAVRLLRTAERDPAALPAAARAINALPSMTKRHIWASYAAVTKPLPPA